MARSKRPTTSSSKSSSKAASLLAILALGTATTSLVNAQDDSVWTGTGSASFYWHNRYHGCLAMAAYGDYETECPKHFTAATLQRQYPGNRNRPFEVVGTWGPTPKYKSEGFMVKVPEMNKILMVFKGIYGWQNFNATLAPLYGVGCDGTCMAHAGAIEAWHEVKAATNDMAAIKRNQGNLVWSASGHAFGGMIMQVGALDLKSRGLLYSAQSFGSPPVFNQAAARRWDNLFQGDSSQRTVANSDSIPAAIPYHGKRMPDGSTSNSQYAFVNTGIHVWSNNGNRGERAMGSAYMYGQNYDVCLDGNQNPNCAGGTVEADSYHYFTDIGYCCSSGTNGWMDNYDQSFNNGALASDERQYSRTAAGVPLPASPVTGIAPSNVNSSVSTVTSTALNTTSTTSSSANSTSSSSTAASTITSGSSLPPLTTLVTVSPASNPTDGNGAAATGGINNAAGNAQQSLAPSTSPTGAANLGAKASSALFGAVFAGVLAVVAL